MKSILLFFTLVLYSVVTLHAQEGFRIAGKTEAPDGKIYLVTPALGGADTLGVADMVGGVFLLTGKVATPCVAFVTTADGKGRFPIMLENTDFKVTMGKIGLLIEGGKDQQLYNEYQEMNVNSAREIAKMESEYKVAMGIQNQMKMKALQEQMKKYMRENQETVFAWMKEHGNSYVVAFIMASVAQKLNYDGLKLLYDYLGPDARASFYGQVLEAKMQMQKKVAVGEIAPNFTVVTPEGKTVSLYDIKGKVKLIDFWASWCKPCRAENKNVTAIYKKYHKKGLEIFGVSMDKDAAAWKQAIADDGLVWYHGSDLKGMKQSPVAQLYGVTAIPHTLLLDENNRIVAKNLRGNALQAKIAEMLKK